MIRIFCENHRTKFLVIAALIWFTASVIASMRLQSLTSDEGIHLSAGYSTLHRRDYRMNPEHPPLVKKLAAIPFAFLHKIDFTELPSWTARDQETFAGDMIYHEGVGPDDILFMGRLMLVPFGILTCIFVFLFSKSLWGESGGLISLGLCALCPNLIAHTRWIHNDVALTASFMICAYVGKKYWEKTTLKNALYLSLALSLALCTKFSGVLLIPFIGLVFLGATRQFWKKNPKQAGIQMLILVGVPLVLISWPYGYLFNPMIYLKGFRTVYANHNPDYAYFMNGTFKPGGFFLYYPFALLLKIPLPSWLLIFGGIICLRKAGLLKLFFVIFPAAVLMGAGIYARHNIGIRHVMPCIPFLFVAAGSLGPLVKSKRLAAAMVSILFLWLIVENIRIYPDYLAYFNQLAGGPDGGIRYLDDSNLDWGQDLKRLPAAMQKLEITKIKLNYSWPERPEFRGIRYEKFGLLDSFFPNGDYAISAHVLRKSSLKYNQDVYCDWLEHYRPASIIGHSIYIYRFRIDSKNEFSQGINYIDRKIWSEHGLDLLNALLIADPDCIDCLVLKSKAELQYGSVDRAIDGFEKLRALRPSLPASHYNLGVAWIKKGNIQKAKEHMKEALRFGPDYAEALFNLGVIAEEEGNHVAAIRYYESALQKNPQYASAHYNLGALRFNAGEYLPAIFAFEKAARLQPDSAENLITLAKAYAAVKQWDFAAEAYEEALRLEPNREDLHLKAAALYIVQDTPNSFKKAESHYLKVLEINPQNGIALYNLAVIAFEQHDKAKALRLTESARAAGFKVPEAFLRELKSFR